MHIGLIGLGKMGMPLAQNINRHHRVTAFDTMEHLLEEAANRGISTARSIQELLQKIPAQKVIWLMVPAGHAVDKVLEVLKNELHPGDIIIDGGNSFYKDSIRRSHQFYENGIAFLDCGTSGGMEGAANGICSMVGGSQTAYETCATLFRDISVSGGHLYCGESGSGHFVKMVHNGIEYGMMQSIAEGFDLLRQAPYPLMLDQIADVYCNGSVIRGWLMELTARAFSKDASLSRIKGIAHASGEAQWMVETADELRIPVPATRLALEQRYASQHKPSFAAKVIAALRNEFGGHAVEKESGHE